MFDAIDKSFQLKLNQVDGEPQHDASMTDLYEGLSQSYVKCHSCGNESVQHDRF